LRNGRNRFEATEARLRLLGPEQVLSRGYSITMDAATGKVLRAAKDVKAASIEDAFESGRGFEQG